MDFYNSKSLVDFWQIYIAQGGTSPFPGAVELMLHRRLLDDDAFGQILMMVMAILMMIWGQCKNLDNAKMSTISMITLMMILAIFSRGWWTIEWGCIWQRPCGSRKVFTSVQWSLQSFWFFWSSWSLWSLQPLWSWLQLHDFSIAMKRLVMIKQKKRVNSDDKFNDSNWCHHDTDLEKALGALKL